MKNYKKHINLVVTNNLICKELRIEKKLTDYQKEIRSKIEVLKNFTTKINKKYQEVRKRKK